MKVDSESAVGCGGERETGCAVGGISRCLRKVRRCRNSRGDCGQSRIAKVHQGFGLWAVAAGRVHRSAGKTQSWRIGVILLIKSVISKIGDVEVSPLANHHGTRSV